MKVKIIIIWHEVPENLRIYAIDNLSMTDVLVVQQMQDRWVGSVEHEADDGVFEDFNKILEAHKHAVVYDNEKENQLPYAVVGDATIYTCGFLL